MDSLLPGIVVSFREGLEAFLILMLIVKFLHKTSNTHLNRSVLFGFLASVVISSVVGFLLFTLSSRLGTPSPLGKVWESVVSLMAVGFVASFVLWMIRHGSEMVQMVEKKAAVNLTTLGIFFVSFILIAREGVEIAFFSFAGDYPLVSIVIGVVAALVLSVGIYFSLVKVKLSLLLKITLVYLVLQTGYLLGYGLHEGLSALRGFHTLDANSLLFTKAFDLSNTILDHKEGALGAPLHLLLGWYSKPEWLQFLAQYLFTGALLVYWRKMTRATKTTS
jgi:high-affinity iron transporter